MNCYFNLPDFLVNTATYELIRKWQKQYPEIFYPNTDIACIYGCPNNVIWNGGGLVLGNMIFKPQLRDMVAYYNEELNLPLRITFTNPLITEQYQLYDTYANVVTEAFHNGKNEILVNSPLLEEYLRKNYPNFKYCRSILAAEHTYYDADNYYLTVLKRDMNNNWEFLDSIPKEARSKIEILCTDTCPAWCNRLYTHYKDFAKGQLTFDTDAPNINCSCEDARGVFDIYKATQTNPKYVTRELIDTQYLPREYCQFKLAGRTSVSVAIVNVLQYMILPEYRLDVAGNLIALYTG